MRHVNVQRLASCVEGAADRNILRLGGVVWHAALPLVDLCTLSRPVDYSTAQYVGEIDRSGWHANLFVSNQEV